MLNEDFKIINGDSLKILDTLPENSIDAIITDPPYGLTSITKRFGKENSSPAKEGKDGSFARLTKGFMGKEWDGSGIEYNIELWAKALKVLKPGGYLCAFGGTRTYHRIACAIEDAGFEIRDCLMWIYGSGFPKSLNIGLAIDKKNGVKGEVIKKTNAPLFKASGEHKLSFGQNGVSLPRTTYEKLKATNEWDGWGTALKPSYEPIIVARKPVENTVIENIEKWHVGGINIDECRVPFGNETDNRVGTDAVNTSHCGFWSKDASNDEVQMYKDNGRYPANTILTYDETDFEEVCGGMPITKSNYDEKGSHETEIHRENADNLKYGYKERVESGYNDEGNACRYFYCAKASKKDRDNGLEQFEAQMVGDGCERTNKETGRKYGGERGLRKNIHPTVKPVELMQYLVRLVTPRGGTVLDIFNGSGSTGKAVAFENRERDAHYKYIGIELDPEYCKISEARIDYALNKFEYEYAKEVKEFKSDGGISLFDFDFSGANE